MREQRIRYAQFLKSHKMNKNIPLVGVVGYPRVGSNLLMEKLKVNTSSIALYEFFNYQKPMVEHLDYINKNFGSFEEFRKFSINNSVEAIKNFIYDISGEVCIYKLFPGHLPSAAFETLAHNTQTFLFLKRNLLSSWSSDLIATQLANFCYGDNSILSIPWSLSKFVDWSIHVLDHLIECNTIANKSSCQIVDFTYSEIANPKFDSKTIWSRINKSIVDKIPVTIDENYVITLTKQDPRNPLERFETPEQVKSDLIKLDLEYIICAGDDFDVYSTHQQLKEIQYKYGFYN